MDIKGNPSAINYGNGFIPKGLKMSTVKAKIKKTAKTSNKKVLKKTKKRTANKLPINMSGQYGQKGKLK